MIRQNFRCVTLAGENGMEKSRVHSFTLYSVYHSKKVWECFGQNVRSSKRDHRSLELPPASPLPDGNTPHHGINYQSWPPVATTCFIFYKCVSGSHTNNWNGYWTGCINGKVYYSAVECAHPPYYNGSFTLLWSQIHFKSFLLFSFRIFLAKWKLWIHMSMDYGKNSHDLDIKCDSKYRKNIITSHS